MDGKTEGSFHENTESIIGTRPDAIFILSGGVTTDSDNKTKSTPYGSRDNIGLLGGGKARVIVAGYLAEEFPNTPVVTNSTVTTADGRIEPHALVYANELRRMGVSGQQLIVQEQSNSTATELIELLRLVNKNQWKTVRLITNDYHLPRVRAMYENLERLFTPEYDTDLNNEVKALILETQKNGLNVQFQAAEDILPLRSPHYSKLIREVKETPAYGQRIAAEEKGTADIKEGRYKLRKPNPTTIPRS